MIAPSLPKIVVPDGQPRDVLKNLTCLRAILGLEPPVSRLKAALRKAS